MSYNFDNNQNHYYFNNKNSLPIIFIHGVGLNQQMWKPQIEFFKHKSLITYDLLGHGKTPFNDPNLSMENFTDQLSNLVNNLKIEKFNLIGFSIGSLIAIEFASKYEKYLNSLTHHITLDFAQDIHLKTISSLPFEILAYFFLPNSLYQLHFVFLLVSFGM